MRQIVKMAGIIGLSVTMLAGCGASSAKSSGSMQSSKYVSSTGSEISGALTIWYNTYSYEEGLKQLISEFNKTYPDVDVEYEIKADGDYDSLLKTAVQSGSGPDLFWTNGTVTSTFPDFVKNGSVVDLTDAVDFSFISDEAMKLGTVDGKAYSVPWMTLDTRTVYYNKDLFEKNGWKVPTTFDEFEKLLATIKESKITPISLAYDPWTMLFVYEPLLAGFDPEYCAGLADYSVKATDEPARKAMQKMVDWADKGYFGDNWLGVTDSSAQNLAFTTGNAAMDIGGSWDAPTLAQNNPNLHFGAFAIPSAEGKTALVGTSSNGFSVNADTQNMNAALAFAKFCATKDAQTTWVQATDSVSATDEIEASSPIAKEISDSGNGQVFRSWQSVLSSYSENGEGSTIWSEDFTKVFDGEMTVNDLMDEIAVVMQ